MQTHSEADARLPIPDTRCCFVLLCCPLRQTCTDSRLCGHLTETLYFPPWLLIRLREVKWGLQPAAFAPLQAVEHAIGWCLVSLTGWWETALAQSEWVCLFYWKALANERTNSCWARCVCTQPIFRLTAPSAGGCWSCYFFVSCQVTLPTLGCVAVLYKYILLCFKFGVNGRDFCTKALSRFNLVFFNPAWSRFIFTHGFSLSSPSCRENLEFRGHVRVPARHFPFACTKGVRGQTPRLQCRWGSGMLHCIECPPCQSSVHLILSVVHVNFYIFKHSFLKCFAGGN